MDFIPLLSKDKYYILRFLFNTIYFVSKPIQYIVYWQRCYTEQKNKTNTFALSLVVSVFVSKNGSGYSVVPEFQPDVPILRSKLLKKKEEGNGPCGQKRIKLVDMKEFPFVALRPVRCPEEKGQKNLLTFN